MSKKVIYETSYPEKRKLKEQGETFDTATHDQMMKLVNGDIDFNNRMMQVLSQILPVDRRAQMIGVLRQRNQQLTQMGRQQQQRAQKVNAEQQRAADAYADTDAASSETRSTLSTRA